jgi:hypothetical protein
MKGNRASVLLDDHRVREWGDRLSGHALQLAEGYAAHR